VVLVAATANNYSFQKSRIQGEKMPDKKRSRP